MSEEEVFLPVPNFPGYYVSREGVVMSTKCRGPILTLAKLRLVE
jgi:hypothetical protein